MTELRNRTVNPLPEAAPTPRRERGVVKHLPRQKLNEDLGLEFPLEDWRGSEVPRNGQVLRHLNHFLHDAKGERSVLVSAKLTVETVKRCWVGANVKMACDRTLLNRVQALYKFMR